MSVAAESPKVVTMYDAVIDEVRPVTQDDVDRWQSLETAYGATRYILRRLLGCPPPIVPTTDWKEEAAFLRMIAQKVDDRIAIKAMT